MNQSFVSKIVTCALLSFLIIYLTWWGYCFWYSYYGRYQLVYERTENYKRFIKRITDTNVKYYIAHTTVYYVHNTIEFIETENILIGTKYNGTNRKIVSYREHQNYCIK
jgi:hypothetical protein